jgi:cell wall-associated NlpC family hydrolase
VSTPVAAYTDLAVDVETVSYDGHADAADRMWRMRLDRASRSDSKLTAAPVKKKATAATKPAAAKKAAAGTQTGKAPAKKAAAGPAPKAVQGAAATVVAYARTQVGKRYVFATAGPNTFDCSGLVKAAYARIGISLPHQTGGLAGRGRSVARSHLAPGDLVFPSSGHVGIYVGGNMMVHASNPRTGVKLSTIYAFSFARRIL